MYVPIALYVIAGGFSPKKLVVLPPGNVQSQLVIAFPPSLDRSEKLTELPMVIVVLLAQKLAVTSPVKLD